MISRQAFFQLGKELLRLRNLSTNVTKPKTGIVMLNMGGPERTDQVYEYLYKIMTDRDMIQLPIAQE
ncbi:hypothetical protein NQ314_007921 [Rhamnusium bicolor]|uniref:Ferrochelatase n=1 Tax=Rhamnusium bicolor TaxID=1586634 RepID=A0AAV8YF76_9CUCU|nr:hypothetical protein NQ314_007921 [Rhamnusium bicolor]